MRKTLLTMIVLAVLMLCLMAGCAEKSSVLTQDEAVQIALEELGITTGQAQTHTHITEFEGKPCYSIHVYVGTESYEVVIDSVTGEVLNVGDASH